MSSLSGWQSLLVKPEQPLKSLGRGVGLLVEVDIDVVVVVINVDILVVVGVVVSKVVERLEFISQNSPAQPS